MPKRDQRPKRETSDRFWDALYALVGVGIIALLIYLAVSGQEPDYVPLRIGG